MPTPATKPIITSSYTFTTIDDPGTTIGTTLTGLNDSGVLIGHAGASFSFGTGGFIDENGTFTNLVDSNSSGVVIPEVINKRGEVGGSHPLASTFNTLKVDFLYNKGSFTDITQTETIFTSRVTSINSNGDVVGINDPIKGSGGFIYQNGQYSSLNVPGAFYNAPMAINDRGAVAGFDGGFGTPLTGYIYQNGSFTPVVFPGASSTTLVGLNNHGEAIGNASSGSVSEAFTYQNGKFAIINVPGAEALAINDGGTVVGNIGTNIATGIGAAIFGPALTIGEHGFVYSNGQTTIIDMPGATGTDIVGINNKGEIAGNYLDINGVGHGFTAVDPHTFDFSSVSPTTFAPPASGTILTDPSPSGASASMSMSTSLVDPSLLVTPHIST